jgi:glutamate N-acetyltransferase/amino-acid N-acetyltransferase
MSVSAPDVLEMITGGVTTPTGFRAAGVSAGIKPNNNLDLALIVSDRPAAAAAVFTTNRARAAPVVVSMRHLVATQGHAHTIIVNSGCANACTGEAGLDVARQTAEATARAVGCRAEEVLVASTGVIGVSLSIDKIRSGLNTAVKALGYDQGAMAARAIMTTDRFPKEAAVRLALGGRDVVIGGMAKGSGMIEPMMATMLAFVTTDGSVPAPLLDRALREVVDDTFNAISVDGECSTNDTVMLLANGASGAVVNDATYGLFVQGLRAVCLRTISVTGSASAVEARRAAKAIANSLLVKTAIHGGDPNWGRLVAVAGRAGVAFDPMHASVTIGGIVLFKDGQPHDENAPRAAHYLKYREIAITVDLGAGPASSMVWTCDLSAEYVRINAEYRT